MKCTMLFVLALVACHADARGVTAGKAHVIDVNGHSDKAKGSKISPPLEDVKSDKKFFGPPFPADYPEDSRPVPDKSIMDKLKSPDQPYPALQSKADFDRDYVKDENSDRGAWKAQFEYDSLRKRLAKEAADAKWAEANAGKEGTDVEKAQRKVDDAKKGVDDARKGADDAMHGDDDAKTAEDFEDMPPSHENLDKLKKAVAEAEANYEKEKKDFAECQRQLDEAKAAVEDLKAKQAEMEAKLAADTKLWVETKSVRMNLKKSKEEAAHTKVSSAQERLNVAQAEKADMDKTLAEKKARHEAAQQSLSKQKAQLAKFKQDLDRATVTLQKLRGYTPADTKPAKSSAPMASAFLSFVALVAMNA